MARQTQSPARRKIRILIVDDDRLSRTVATRALQRLGHQVYEAVNGRQALAVFRHIAPDLILLDVEMPHVNGFQVCAALRRTALGSSVPIVMMTGREDQKAIDQAFAAGATDYVCKPVNWSLMAHRIPRILETFALQRSSRNNGNTNQPRKRLLSTGGWRWTVYSDAFQCSASIQRLLDKLPQNATLADYLAFVDEAERDSIRDTLHLAVARNQPFSSEHRVTDTTRGERLFLMKGRLTNEHPAVMEGTFQDITERRAVDESVRRLAYQDSLTGLTNKPTFVSRLDQAIRQAEFKRHALAVLYIDLDDFKQINEKLGHNLGDQVLTAIGKTIRLCIRNTDTLSGTAEEDISRIGGDKFAILLSPLDSAETAGAVAKRILDELEAPESEIRGPLKASASIGISLYPKDGNNSGHLLARAEEAMRYAKLTGKHYYRYYDARMNSPAYNRFGIERPLRHALEKGEFRIEYHPQIDIVRGQVVGVEALIRWDSPEHGAISPERFIPIAEKMGIMEKIDQWVLETACQQVQSWHDRGLAPINLSINVSDSRFFSHDFAGNVEFALEKSGFPAEQLTFELLENSIMKDAHATTRRLLEIRELGCKIALDNFGAGLSSISYLRRFNLDFLKIDRQFIRQAAADPDDSAIVRTIMNMANNLGLEVIAQGVESKTQLRYLRTTGCRLAQGFLFARPLSGEQIFKALMRRAKTAAESVA